MKYALVSKQNSKYNLRNTCPPSVYEGNPENWRDVKGLYLTLDEGLKAFNEESIKKRKWIQLIQLENYHVVKAERVLFIFDGFLGGRL